MSGINYDSCVSPFNGHIAPPYTVERTKNITRQMQGIAGANVSKHQVHVLACIRVCAEVGKFEDG